MSRTRNHSVSHDDEDEQFSARESIESENGSHKLDVKKLVAQELAQPILDLSGLLVDFTEVEREKIIAMRIKEAKNLSGNKLSKYLTFLQAQIELIKSIDVMENEVDSKKIKIENYNKPHEKSDTKLATQALEEFQKTYQDASTKIKNLANTLIKSPYTSVQPKDLNLLAETTKSLHAFMLNPAKKENMKNLMANTRMVYQKMGTFWTSVKNALTAVIGAGCIVVGVLGLVPTFGASLGFMVLGGLMCTRAGLSTFKMNSSFANPDKKTADELSNDTRSLFKQAEDLLNYKKEIKKEERQINTRPARPSN